jgi:hypothetical protein
MNYLKECKFFVMNAEKDDALLILILKALGFELDLRFKALEVSYIDIYYNGFMVNPDEVLELIKHKLSQIPQ